MRNIGHIEDEEQARVFGNYLYVRGIENEIEAEEDGAWAVWVLSEEQLAEAEELLTSYLQNPSNPEIHNAASTAGGKRTREKKEEAAAAKRMIFGNQLWPEGHSARMGRLTLSLIVISIAVSVFSKLGADNSAIHGLFISEFRMAEGHWWQGLPELRHGQIWRLVTPIFIHFGILHLLFNMLWLRDLGTMIERRKGPLMFGTLVLVVAAASNLGQYATSGPLFGGMSGVVYGLLGYVWMKGKHDPAAGLRLHQSTVTMMIAWYFLCLAGIFGPIANTAHTVGLVIGIAWGYLSSRSLS